MKKRFIETSKTQFNFLIENYGFKIISLVDSPRGYFEEGQIIFATEATYIFMEHIRGETPSFCIGRTKDISHGKDKREYLLPFNLIYEYMVTTDEEKIIIISSSVQSRVSKIVDVEKNVHREFFSVNEQEEELKIYANLIEKYAYPFLVGDFSKWRLIWEYKVKRGIAQEMRYGRSEYKDIAVPDGSGKFRVVGKKHLYQDALDYIKRLESELN